MGMRNGGGRQPRLFLASPELPAVLGDEPGEALRLGEHDPRRVRRRVRTPAVLDHPKDHSLGIVWVHVDELQPR